MVPRLSQNLGPLLRCRGLDPAALSPTLSYRYLRALGFLRAWMRAGGAAREGLALCHVTARWYLWLRLRDRSGILARNRV